MKLVAISQDKALALSICTEFKQQGYEVFPVNSLKDTEKICQTEKPDILIAEQRLSDGNFFDFYDLLKEQYQNDVPPVAILLTEQATDLTADVAIAMGLWALFTKPFQMKSLYYSVEDAIFSRKAGYTKRLDERIELTSKVDIKLPNSESFISTFSTNISFGGFFVALTQEFPEVGSIIEFKIMFSASEGLEGKGRVAWVRKESKTGEQAGCGVQFTEGREKYVKILVPIINETRTRQIESASFKAEDLNEILTQSVRAAKEKISKTVTEISLVPQNEKISIMCRSPQMLSVFSLLIYEIVYPMRDIKGSKCMIAVQKKEGKQVDIIITCMPPGASLFVEALIEEKIQPILDMHKAKINCEFNSISSKIIISLAQV